MGKMILSLDQSLHVSGYCVFKNDKVYTSGTWEIPTKKPIEQRLNMILTKMNKLYDEHEFSQVVFEDIQLQAGNVDTYRKLAYVQAAIIIWCYNNDIKFKIVSPSHWRSVLKSKESVAFGRKREEQKKAAVDFVRNKFDLEVSSDEADAIALGWASILENTKDGAF